MKPARAKFAIFIALLCIAGMSVFLFAKSSTTRAQSSGSVTGYAWSSMPDGSDEYKTSSPASGQGGGWISFSCQNEGTCAASDYGVSVDGAGTISGKAWSYAIGWISFDAGDVSGCPSGSCQGHLDTASGSMTGWARALGGEQNSAGGWDGWIHLSGSGYGVELRGCNWSGYAWGGAVLGWIKFSGSAYGVSASGVGCQQATASITAQPSVLTGEGTTTVSWRSAGADSCTGTNFSTGGATSGSVELPISQNTIYSLTCGNGIPARASVLVSVNYPAPVVSLSASPSLVGSGATTTLEWSAQNVQEGSCSISQQGSSFSRSFANGQKDSGSVVSPALTGQSTFIFTCIGLDTSTTTASVTVNLIPTVQEF